jgi:hypothetical protein
MVLWNVDMLPEHYTASQPRRHRLSPWRWRQHGPPKRWYPITTLHSVRTQKTLTWFTPPVWFLFHGLCASYNKPEDHDLNLHRCENLKSLTERGSLVLWYCKYNSPPEFSEVCHKRETRKKHAFG